MTIPFALDCQSFESALETSAAILGVAPKTLRHKLAAVKFEELLEWATLGRRQRELPAPAATCWFHATRAVPEASFEDGIQPLSTVLERIWAFLGKLASDWSTRDEWQRFRSDMPGQGGEHYRLKMETACDEGPFAFLVRQTIFCPQTIGNHDYLRVPEIVEDICASYREAFNRPLLQRYLEATQPCIVKFRSNETCPEELATALLYLHTTVRREDLWLECNINYCGQGKPIDRKDILRVEWPEWPLSLRL